VVKWGSNWVSIIGMPTRRCGAPGVAIALNSDKSPSERLDLFKTKKKGAERYYVG
jgi:hypothetical protein